ncbi:JAB domain-containing protein [Erythrobacter sp. R86502]|uniref:JAB domain-containing protein n=1 Tax=Erythrobacter sp. R86502 TaxID=3093846 RepID=UPI0036D3E0CB
MSILTFARPFRGEVQPSSGQRAATMIAHLRGSVLAPPLCHERAHAIFVDADRVQIGDQSCGIGTINTLTLRMRTLLAEALRRDAAGIILAHSHPSGHCRPSRSDIAATRRLAEVARALDIALIDHLIFTHEAVYSMRAGGFL